MELKIKFETEIEYFDNISPDSKWYREVSGYIYKNIYNLNKNLSMEEKLEDNRKQKERLLDYPQFYYSGYIKFFTKEKEIIYPFNNEKSNTICNFTRDELCSIAPSSHFFEENKFLLFSKPTTLNIELKLDLVEKI